VLVVVGLAVFIAVGVAGLLLGYRWLEYPQAWAGTLILVIEVAATLSIATSLTLLVVGEKEELRS
jgi:predicted permease